MISIRLLSSAVLVVLLTSTAVAQTKLTFVNGIQVATPADAWESARGMVTILNASTNRPPAQQQSFEPEAIWNPIGFYGTPDGQWDRSQDLKEVFLLKVAEERYAQHFLNLVLPHNNPRVLDVASAQAVRAYYDDLTPGENSLDPAVGQPGQVVTDGDMARTKSAIAEIIEALKAPGRRIFVAHSQGNLLVNLAWASYVAEVGQAAVSNARFINVGNTSRFSINGLNLTHAGDKILFADQGGGVGTDLERLAVREGWRRTTPYCPGYSLCNFGMAAPTFADGDDYSGTNDGFEHFFLPTYLSTSRIPVRLVEQRVTFTDGATRYRDRFEDLVYAAVSSLEPPVTVSAASCTAPVVGQAMTCSVTGTNLPSTVSATASNCSPSSMTVATGSTAERRQFSCTPVTAGQLVQVSYVVPEFIGPLPPIPAVVAAPPPLDPQVAYQQSFDTDPAWQTDQPGYYYWNATNQTYFARAYTGAPTTRPNRYGTIQLPTFDPNRGFTLTWDQKINAFSGPSSAVFFGLMSDDRLVIGSTNINRPPLIPESTVALGIGRVAPGVLEYTSYRIYVANEQNLGGSGTHGATFVLGRWYRLSIQYSPTQGVVTFTAIDRDTSEVMPYYNFSRTVPANAFSPNMRWLGVANDAIGYSTFSDAPPESYAEAEFDNVSLVYLEPQTPYNPSLTISPVIVPIGGSATLSWDTGGAPVSACTLTRGASPITLTGTTGSVVITNIQGRTTFTLTCGSSSATRTIEIIPSTGGT